MEIMVRYLAEDSKPRPDLFFFYGPLKLESAVSLPGQLEGNSWGATRSATMMIIILRLEIVSSVGLYCTVDLQFS